MHFQAKFDFLGTFTIDAHRALLLSSWLPLEYGIKKSLSFLFISNIHFKGLRTYDLSRSCMKSSFNICLVKNTRNLKLKYLIRCNVTTGFISDPFTKKKIFPLEIFYVKEKMSTEFWYSTASMSLIIRWQFFCASVRPKNRNSKMHKRISYFALYIHFKHTYKNRFDNQFPASFLPWLILHSNPISKLPKKKCQKCIEVNRNKSPIWFQLDC